MPIRFTHKPGLVVYLTAGDAGLRGGQFSASASLNVTREIAIAAIDAGADVIELGVPFSDPLADGPIIQRASERALARGTRLKDVLAVARGIRAARPAAGLIIFTYLNPVLRYGSQQRLPDDAKASGADGVLVTDLIVEEAAEYPGREMRGSRGPRTRFSCRAHQSRRAPESDRHQLQGFCLRHFACWHYGHAAERRLRCRLAGRAHQAMDLAAGGRGVRHQ